MKIIPANKINIDTQIHILNGIDTCQLQMSKPLDL